MKRPRQQDPWLVVQEAVRHWYWMPLAVLGLGIASVLLVLGGSWVRGHLVEEDVRLVRAVGEIQTLAAISHLWIEEYVSGDEVDPERIEADLERAIASIDDIVGRLEGGRGRLFSARLRERELPAAAHRVRSQLESFAALTRDRREGYRRGRLVGIGSPVDVEYDRVFHQLLEDLRALDAALEERLLAAEKNSRLLLDGVVAGWSLIVGLAVIGLWTRERRRKRAEAALRESQVQLLQSQKMEAVGRLAGGIAHDINNYLAAITAQCELARMKAEPGGRLAAKMDSVLATTARASTLIRQLVAFSKRQPAQPEAVDLNRTVGGMERMLRRLLGEDIELRTHLEPELWSVRIDVAQAEQVLLNLAVNAREAMPEGGSLEIATANRRGNRKNPGPWVVLSVKDDGSGIPEEIRDKIFEPFFTSKDASASSGLGLSIVLGIVEQNGGRIEIDTAPGRGTRFEVWLPRSETPAADEPPAPRPLAAPGGDERILLVEDNRQLRESTRQILERLGYAVTTAGDGRQALEVYELDEEGYDLVITDVVMPAMSGRTLARSLLRLRPDQKILFVSGHADHGVDRSADDSPPAHLLEKPFEARALAEAIRDALRGQAPARG